MNMVCTVSNALKLMEHMDKNDIVVVTVVNKRTHEHEESKKLRKEKGEEYIRGAEKIFYQDDDFFGTLILNGVIRDKDIIHGVLFPQRE